MKVDAFDFDLPAESIALHPAEPRDSARMLVVHPGEPLVDGHVRDLLTILRPGDVLVVNDTRVLPAELTGTRIRGELRAGVSINLHKRVDASSWKAFARPAKKLELGDRLELGDDGSIIASVAEKGDAGEVTLHFELSSAALDGIIKAHGALPLPPYIGLKRGIEERDKSDYQTVYAQKDGAVAAPTAGLHFTPELLAELEAHGVSVERVTLHVGAGTFLPVKADDTDDHKMHAEWGELPPDVVERIHAAKAKGGRLIAVGTTSLRLLESAARPTGMLAPFTGDTDIFITPGYRFNAVDVLMTNFHLPRSTLFMLVSAFAGFDTMHAAYRHAIDTGYRFYSYGDASLLFRAE
jgi:S-adenosylmethionine:tRNA ribosyltransferase-isomerase